MLRSVVMFFLVLNICYSNCDDKNVRLFRIIKIEKIVHLFFQKQFNIEVVANSRADLGEGPHWDVESQSLYYVDIYAGKLLRYSWKRNKIFSCYLGEFSMWSMSFSKS